MLFVVDACSIINILLIDEDDFLFSEIQSLNIKITPKVYSEIRINLRGVIEGDFADYDKKLAELIPYTNVYHDYELQQEDEVVELYERDFKELTSYSKRNGEFCSAICSSVLSRTQKSKVVFYTDDYKAKSDFMRYFDFHQIGYIEDSIDLLIFLFSNNDSFRLPTLLRMLSNLRSRYLADHGKLVKQLQNRYEDLTSKDKDEKMIINKLIKSISTMELEDARKQVESLNHKKDKDILKLVNQYESLFEIENEYVKKIIKYENYFKAGKLFKLYN